MCQNAPLKIRIFDVHNHSPWGRACKGPLRQEKAAALTRMNENLAVAARRILTLDLVLAAMPTAK